MIRYTEEKKASALKRMMPPKSVSVAKLSAEYGKGFSPQSLWNFRQFYLEFPILSTAWRELRWSHYKVLMRVKDTGAATFVLFNLF